MLRLVDANLDRLGEGLRVLEDVSRFLLNDVAASRRLKALRHSLIKSLGPLEQDLLSARRVAEDIGAPLERTGGPLLDGTGAPLVGRTGATLERAGGSETRSGGPDARRKASPHQDLLALVRANSRRAQESLRVLEEFGRLSGGPLEGRAGGFEKARFEVYELEQHLVGRLSRQERAGRLRGLYLVLDMAALGTRHEAEVAAAAIRGGTTTIQLRDKHRCKADVLATARALRSVCAEKGALFVVNDHLDVALAVGADAVHLGQDDLPVPEARRILPLEMLIGCSTHSTAEAVQAQAGGADYVALGSIYPTTSKERYRLVGLEALRRTRSRLSVPLVAIGGINEANAREVMKAGADAVAVISAVLGADNVEKAARSLAARAKPVSDRRRRQAQA